MACRVFLVLSFDFNLKIFKILMYDVIMTSFLCFCRQKDLKGKKRHNDVKMTSDWKFMFVF